MGASLTSKLEIVISSDLATTGFSALHKLNPVDAADVLEIELAPEIDPNLVLKEIKFGGEWDFDEAVAARLSDELPWLEAFENGRVGRGLLERLAVAVQGDRRFRVAFIFEGGSLRPVLVDLDEPWVAEGRYPDLELLASFGFHTEGPGPVSWDGGGALYAGSGFWLEAYDGDVGSDDRAYPEPSSFGKAFVDWLARNGSIASYLIANARCNWRDKNLAARFAELASAISDINPVFANLSISQKESIDVALSGLPTEYVELAEVLGSQVHDLIEPLVELMQDVVDSESAHPLRGNFDLKRYAS